MGGNTEGEGELEGPASVDEGVPVAAAATGESEGGCVGGMERVGAPTVALPSALPLLLALLLSLKLYEGGALCEAQLELVVTAVAVRGGEREANAAVGVPPLLTVAEGGGEYDGGRDAALEGLNAFEALGALGVGCKVNAGEADAEGLPEGNSTVGVRGGEAVKRGEKVISAEGESSELEEKDGEREAANEKCALSEGKEAVGVKEPPPPPLPPLTEGA